MRSLWAGRVGRRCRPRVRIFRQVRLHGKQLIAAGDHAIRRQLAGFAGKRSNGLGPAGPGSHLAFPIRGGPMACGKKPPKADSDVDRSDPSSPGLSAQCARWGLAFLPAARSRAPARLHPPRAPADAFRFHRALVTVQWLSSMAFDRQPIALHRDPAGFVGGHRVVDVISRPPPVVPGV